MKKQIISISLLLVGLLLSTLSFGQGPKAERKALKKDVKAYVEKNILPVMQPQRAALDQELSKAEQKELSSIREGLEALRTQKRTAMKGMHEEMKQSGQRPEPTEAQIQARREAQKTHRQLMTRAWALLDAHEATIYRLLDEVKSDQQQWKKDLGEMVQQHREEVGDQGPEGRPPHGHHARRGEHGPKPLAAFHEPLAFLLWDGTPPKGPREGIGPEETDVRVFPNPLPANGNNQVRFELKKAGKVTISLMDEGGTVIKTLLQEERAAGVYTEQFQLKDLPAGIYYYRVETPDQRQVKRILVE